MPEIENANGAGATAEPRAIHYIRLAFEDGLDQPAVFGGVVLQIGILNDDNLRGGVREAGTQRRAFASVDLMAEELDAQIGFGNRLQDLSCSILRAIVHDD